MRPKAISARKVQRGASMLLRPFWTTQPAVCAGAIVLLPPVEITENPVNKHVICFFSAIPRTPLMWSG